MADPAFELTALLLDHLDPRSRTARLLHEVLDPDHGPIDQPHIQISGLGTLFANPASDGNAVAVATPIRLDVPAQTVPFDPSSSHSVHLAADAAVAYLTLARRAGPRQPSGS